MFGHASMEHVRAGRQALRVGAAGQDRLATSTLRLRYTSQDGLALCNWNYSIASSWGISPPPLALFALPVAWVVSVKLFAAEDSDLTAYAYLLFL